MPGSRGRYDRLHDTWLRLAGGEAQAAFEAGLTACLRPGTRLLDAGCGTGALVRRLLDGPAEDLRPTLLDCCPQMLEQARDLPCTRRLGTLLALPFADATFDVVCSSWAIEACEDPIAAIAEMSRVLRPGGSLHLAFCAERPGLRPAHKVMQTAVRLRRTGRFLNPPEVVAAIAAGTRTRPIVHRSGGPAAAVMAIKAEAGCQAMAA